MVFNLASLLASCMPLLNSTPDKISKAERERQAETDRARQRGRERQMEQRLSRKKIP